MADQARETLWILRAQLGARDAFDALFHSVQEPLFRYLVGLVRDQALAEDILQEVFLRIYQKLSWLREPALFRPWCYRIATREAFRWLKRERRWVDQVRDSAVLDTIAARPDEPILEPGLLARLPELLDQVSPACRTVLALHYIEQLSLDEMAEVLGIPTGTVKSRLAHGLMRLRRVLMDVQDS
jgi:RNA polymerase sigma-70 factor (ECF subfamily)